MVVIARVVMQVIGSEVGLIFMGMGMRHEVGKAGELPQVVLDVGIELR